MNDLDRLLDDMRRRCVSFVTLPTTAENGYSDVFTAIYHCPTCHGDGMDTDIDELRLNAPCDCFSSVCLCLRCRSCFGSGLVSEKVYRRLTKPNDT